jgi:hypothetical protein
VLNYKECITKLDVFIQLSRPHFEIGLFSLATTRHARHLGSGMMTESTPRTDRDAASLDAFATDAQLALRQQIHEQYSQPKINFPLGHRPALLAR